MSNSHRDGDAEAELDTLWQQGQAGDEAAYRAALSLLARRLRAWLRRRLSDRAQEAEDVLQDTLLAIHLRRGTHEADSPVMAWALAIARHKLVDYWRRHGRREALHVSLDDELSFESSVDAPHAGRDLAELLQRLPAAQREAIWLTKVSGLSVQEAAERTGASGAAIKVQVHRGLKRLATWVKTSSGESS